MKTAISLPDEVFAEADALARRLRVSRSRLYARALAELLARERQDEVRERLDEVYGSAESRLDPGLERLQSLSIPREEW